jgi:2-polyprenyl-6-methoxyphenol hydroxylase-like FAD-dependent oxidoreductase
MVGTDKTALIVGAGPAGLALGNLLADANISSRIVDKARQAHQQSRACSIQPKTFELFRSLGLYDELQTRSIPLLGNRVYVDGVLQFEFSFEDPDTGETTVAIEQCVVEQMLRDRLTRLHVEIEQGVECAGITVEANAIRVKLLENNEERDHYADVLVGCDGGRSAVRKMAGIKFPGYKYPEKSFISDIVLESELDRSYMHYFLDAATRLVVVPLPEPNRFKVSGCTSLPEGACARSVLVDSLERHSTGRFCIKEVLHFEFYEMHSRLAETFALDKIVLCGDAAHLMPPNGGQGLSLAFEDAQILAECLGSYLGSEELSKIQPYVDRRTEVEQRIREAIATKKRYSYEHLKQGATERHGEQQRIVAQELR